ncbi:MAG TPA: CHASE2 domain-containing protein [Bradyrhizobium sp.]|jgi:CHASE2 domain-containing sensor protein|nr:CHASE2 domain-containing protein [Bradyrhizobium sp.]
MSETEPPSEPAAAGTTHEGFLASAARRLRSKTISYWISAIVVLIVASAGSPYIYDYLGLKTARSAFFQELLALGPRPTEPRQIKIVRIEDDDYWEGILAGRQPIKRDYVANLVRKLVSFNVHVIALDFDVRLPKPDSLSIQEEYQSETRLLTDAIKAAARNGKKIVLATPVSFADESKKIYRRDSDIYQASGLCLSQEKGPTVCSGHPIRS